MAANAVNKRWLIALVAVPLLSSLAACSGTNDGGPASTPTVAPPTTADEATATLEAESTYRERLVAIDDAVTAWRGAGSIEEAHAAAEAAANLVVGSGGPSYGDRDGNGVVDGETEVGVLPALDGSPTGLANALYGNRCVVADVLGGTWDDPAGRWNTMLTAIDEWRPDHNTMPSLPSHPMRVVGWATFTLASDSLDEAHEYGGHARLHVNVSLEALDC
jgi:hypothetical protein